MRKKRTISYITKHIKYIDYRVAILQNELKQLRSYAAISQIIDLLITESTHNKPFAFSDEAAEAIIDLKALISGWEILSDGDIVGYIYQNLESALSKKKKGQFFTPANIVDYIINKTHSLIGSNSVTMLDPACGSGQFLISMFKYLLNNPLKQDCSYTDRAREVVKQNLFGFDIDPVAVTIARFNLARISGCDETEINIFQYDFLNRTKTDRTVPGGIPEQFDIIAGNPPWGSSLSNEDKKYYKKEYLSGRSGINTFTLFIERSFDFISRKGIVSYLVPEAYLNIKAHRSSRSFIMDKAQIKDIAVWGEQFKGVFAPSISIIFKNENTKELRDKNIINIKNSRDLKDNTTTLVPQNSYYSSPENIFNINYSRRAVNIINAIDNQECFHLKDRAKFFLGIVTGNNEQYLTKEQSDDYPDPIIIGKDVSQYTIRFSDHYFKYCGKSLQQVAPRHLYKTKDKVLYKFIGKKLTFAIERNGYFTLNNVNGFIPEFNFLNIESLISILNSPVMQYYYEKNFFTVKVLRGNLERLPIKLISKENQKKLKQLVNSRAANGTVMNKTACENINDIIYHEYGISDRQAYTLAN